MVERPADVLRMDPAKPVLMSRFFRADMAVRKIPGFGLMIALWLGDFLWTTKNWFGLLILVGAVLAALLEEFVPRVTSLPSESNQPSSR